VQRLFSTMIPWATRCWVFFRHHMYRAEDVYLLAGDEVVVTKAGQHTHGLDRFLSRLYGKPVLGLACFMWSWVSTQARSSFPMCIEPGVRSAAEKAASKAKAEARQQKPSVAKGRRAPGPRLGAVGHLLSVPREHWCHLRTTNVVESPFAWVRLRTTAAKRFKKVDSATALIWKVLQVAETTFQRLNAPELLSAVYAGATYADGIKQTAVSQPEVAA
jgi:hypothetical protein